MGYRYFGKLRFDRMYESSFKPFEQALLSRPKRPGSSGTAAFGTIFPGLFETLKMVRVKIGILKLNAITYYSLFL